MNKESITELLEKKHQNLFNWLEAEAEENWQKGPEGKWTSGQHSLHLLQSIKKVNDALSMPKFLLRSKFGKANREVRPYEAVVKKYQDKLSQHVEKAKEFNSKVKVPKPSEKDYILNRLKTENKKLQYKTNKWKDKDLDNLILPHPLMGKMPVREIIMWTAYHVEHHTKTLKEKH